MRNEGRGRMKTPTHTRYETMQAARMIASRLTHEVARKLSEEEVSEILTAKAQVDAATTRLNLAIEQTFGSFLR